VLSIDRGDRVATIQLATLFAKDDTKGEIRTAFRISAILY